MIQNYACIEAEIIYWKGLSIFECCSPVFQVIYALRNLDRHFQIIVKLIGYFRKFCPLVFFVNNILVTNSSLLCVSSYFSPTSVTVIMISNELLNCIRAFHIDELHSVTTSFFKLKTPCKMLNALNSHSTEGEKLFFFFYTFYSRKPKNFKNETERHLSPPASHTENL